MRTSIFKLLLAFLSITVCQFGMAGPVSDPSSFGEWSQPTNGLRARLAFAEDAKLYGTRMGVLYLELQNVSLGDTMYVYYRAASSPFRCELRDSAGKTNETTGCAYDGWIPAPCWLSLPHDSLLRFRVTLGGFAVPRDGGLFIAGCVSDCWAIPSSATNDYFLSGTLSVAAPKDETRPRVWEGTLKLPLVRIPVKAR
jgi:hypothetical protein